MNIETKVVDTYSSSNFEGGKDEYLHFGWKHTEDTQVHRGRGYRTAHVLARDKDMPNYDALKKLEGEYFNLKSNKKTYYPMEWDNILLAFAFLIIPGIIYVTVKLKQKKRIRQHNDEIEKQMNAVVLKAKPLL
ncbi:MAG: hypothetical protein K2N74_02250 [Clostridiales bacterium]|nr:hypothetical protein [Clostridiales bacterium]